ncbi:MAG: CocE/NonD family hydrolase [Rhodococcus sp. (in: high G+C Gram-positive bacteria)]|uniref:CocE/NonD family hydrolase n=1 Tax=Rhodococcus sp. TaxID=1831 RepID=UPI002AD7D0A1|nr:CocE/NonD family hydrolase [Rhodococcus sp. (in: high G+C Gram-positive bacteria)]
MEIDIRITRVAVALSTAAVLVLQSAGTAGAAPSESPIDPFFGYGRAAEFTVSSERMDVPMRDGGTLACDVNRPGDASNLPVGQKFPTIVYDFNAYDELDQLATDSAYLVERGYNILLCNVRGSGDSPGVLDPFANQEQQDNYDLIEWAAAQPWSTGKVGQSGVSYGGHTAMLAAANNPPHLAAVRHRRRLFSDWYGEHDLPRRIRSDTIRTWQASTAPATEGPYDEHPLYDEYWAERSVKAKWSQIDVPMLQIGGWYDRYRDPMMQNNSAHPDSTWVVAGPWKHGMPQGQKADIGTGAYLAWWDRWLRDDDSAPLPAQRINSYEISSESVERGWQEFGQWPPAESTELRLAMGTDGGLSPVSTEQGNRTYTVPADHTDAASAAVIFSTTPLPADVVITGSPTAQVNATFTAADGNLAVIVDDVAPDGTTERITQGWLKASHRNGSVSPEPVVPGQEYRLDVRAWPTHFRLPAGHRLQVQVRSDDYCDITCRMPPGRGRRRYTRMSAGSLVLRFQYYPVNRPST